MKYSKEIRDAIRAICGKDKGGFLFFNAVVKSVEDDSCTVTYSDIDIPDVRLNAAINGNANNLLIKPKVGSTVLIADLSEGDLRDLAVIGWSEVDSIIVNGGTNEGLVKVKELTDKINTLENSLNSLKSVFSAWVPTPGDGGLVLKTAVITWAGSQLSVTNKADIQNEKIKH